MKSSFQPLRWTLLNVGLGVDASGRARVPLGIVFPVGGLRRCLHLVYSSLGPGSVTS